MHCIWPAMQPVTVCAIEQALADTCDTVKMKVGKIMDGWIHFICSSNLSLVMWSYTMIYSSNLLQFGHKVIQMIDNVPHTRGSGIICCSVGSHHDLLQSHRHQPLWWIPFGFISIIVSSAYASVRLNDFSIWSIFLYDFLEIIYLFFDPLSYSLNPVLVPSAHLLHIQGECREYTLGRSPRN